MNRELWDRRGEMWARGNDGAPAHVWVMRSAFFGLVAAAWSTWGGTATQYLPENPVAEFAARSSTEVLLALYLLYAARSKPKAIVAVIVIIASVIGAKVVGRLSTQWTMARMSEPGYDGSADWWSDPVYWFIIVATGIFSYVFIWAAWGIARRRSSAWLWSLPVPALFIVLGPWLMQNNFEWFVETSARIQLANVIVAVLPVTVSILTGWAADVAFGTPPPEPVAPEPITPPGMVEVPQSAPQGGAADPLFDAPPADDPLFDAPDRD